MVGLTLIEVLIALAIIAIALTAIIKSTSQSIRGTSYLQTKMTALWVGQSIMNGIRVGYIKVDDEKKDVISALAQNWYWLAKNEETPNKRIRKIIVNVYGKEVENAEDETPYVTLEGYLYKQPANVTVLPPPTEGKPNEKH